MVLLEKIWDDVFAGPRPDRGLGKLRKISTQPSASADWEGESSGSKLLGSMPASPATPATPLTQTGPATTPRGDVWRSVFNPGSNIATKSIGGDMFDKPQPNSPTVYDWLYSNETRNIHHRR